MIRRIWKEKGNDKHERRYYISSLINITPEAMGKLIRRHLSIENEFHWHLDVSFREDNSIIGKAMELKKHIRKLEKEDKKHITDKSLEKKKQREIETCKQMLHMILLLKNIFSGLPSLGKSVIFIKNKNFQKIEKMKKKLKKNVLFFLTIYLCVKKQLYSDSKLSIVLLTYGFVL